MTNKDFTVSVCSITYGHEAFIGKMIEGVLNQECEYPFEFIILDDNSPDQTELVVENIQNRIPNDFRIRYIKNDVNLGVIPNFIKALKQCKGKYILFCEGDDFWNDKKKIQKQVDFLEKEVGYVGCYHNVCVVDAHNHILKASKSSKLYNRDISQEELKKGFTISLSSICFRNVITEFPEEFNKTNLGDKFLCSLLGHHGPVKFLKEIEPSAYRFHSGGVWSEKSALDKEKAYVNSHYWMWQYYQRIGNKDLSDYFFKLILKKGYLSSPFNKRGYTVMDKLEYLSLWLLRRTFRVLRYIFR
ncbi:glycosyltransferase [Fulvivirga sp. 29W222]|uniref:Glycosyltransferase n=1 Tax=Fulvivirga marina TaxID=2494733 RepID=A0A937FUQ3_9BACT|nr:glycosyltransferase [Fulvivirga marina]MBL6444758.1 glycosyltransferase [Fulvivirga marina]